MAAVTLVPADLAPFATIDPVKAQAMIDDALALASRVAPCINDADFAYPDAAKAIIRGAVLRWNEAGSGAAQSVQSGPFATTMDTRTQRRGMFWPSEIADLAGLCSDSTAGGKAFEIDTAPENAGVSGVYGEDYYWTGPDSWVTLP